MLESMINICNVICLKFYSDRLNVCMERLYKFIFDGSNMHDTYVPSIKNNNNINDKKQHPQQ